MGSFVLASLPLNAEYLSLIDHYSCVAIRDQRMVEYHSRVAIRDQQLSSLRIGEHARGSLVSWRMLRSEVEEAGALRALTPKARTAVIGEARTRHTRLAYLIACLIGISLSRATPITLQYGSRAAYHAGLRDVTDRPVVSMDREFARDMTWRDHMGVEYSLRGEWAYVTGAAIARDGCSAGFRDEANEGKLPRTFLDETNAFIRRRRARWPSEPSEAIRERLSEAHALLTLEEVLSVRLYSGPAFQPINSFLRQVARLSGAQRRAHVRDHSLTFAATVGHLVSAIRKLAAVATREEASGHLYRGVRGALPPTFWQRDSMGMLCATDSAFMSTSRNRNTPIHYMGGDDNVLWELAPGEEPGAESTSAYHCGADISLLSQFSAEQEVLFPPCTLLHVKGTLDAPPPRVVEGCKKFVPIAAQPSFITV